jgi:hypothetical protein
MENNIKNNEIKTITLSYLDNANNIVSELLGKYNQDRIQNNGYIETLISTFGIIAGFGFTAYEFVKNTNIFWIGEACIIFSIFYLLHKMKNDTLTEQESTENLINQYSEIKKELKNTILESDYSKMKELNNGYLEKINNVSYQPLTGTKLFKKALNKSWYIALLGFILIFSSFKLTSSDNHSKEHRYNKSNSYFKINYR